MTISYAAAVEEMYDLFVAKWRAESAAIVGYVPEMRFAGREKGALPGSDKYWVRISEQAIYEQQATLSNCVEEPGKKRYETSGVLFVQLFAPKSLPDSVSQIRLLAMLARNSYRGKTTDGGIVFRNVRINTLPQEDLFWRSNVVAEYEFGEIG